MPDITVAAFYKFVPLPDCDEFADRIREVCKAQGMVGTCIVAAEGLNATIAGTATGVAGVLDWLRADPRFRDLEVKKSSWSEWPFRRMKVVRKPEIVTLRAPAEPARIRGTYVDPTAWNDVLDDEEIVVIDCRNDFEVRVGSFPGSTDPRIRNFTEFPAFARQHLDPTRHQTVAMFCTGGIRCEKASSFLLQQGFANVLQLRGGILKYLEQVEVDANRWRGECFVFDRRVALRHGLRPGSYRECHGCKAPVGEAERALPEYEYGVSCPSCHGHLTPARIRGLRERTRQMQIAAARGTAHLGAVDTGP